MMFSSLAGGALDIELGSADSTVLFTTARRHAAVNAGVLRFAELTECYVKHSTVSCSHGVGAYNLLSTVVVPGADFIRVAAQAPEYQHTSSGSTATITYRAGRDFERRDVDWLNTYEQGWRASTGGTPRVWYEELVGGRRLIGLFPPPDIGSSESGKLVLSYVARPPTMASSTDVPFTDTAGSRIDLVPYHQAVVHHAAHQLEKLRVDAQASQGQLQIFSGYVASYLAKRNPKGLKAVRGARDYFGAVRSRRPGGGDLDDRLARDY